MIKRTTIFAPIFLLALGSFGLAPDSHSQQQLQRAAAPAVREQAAQATLEKNAVRVMLPLGQAAGPQTRVVVWLISPQDVKSGETVAAIDKTGVKVVAMLALPAEARLEHREDLGWYRIGYRVAINGAEQTHGVLSIGAMTANLMELRVAYAKFVAQGQAWSARVLARNPVTGKALPGVRLKATLVDDESDAQKAKCATRAAVTGRNGEAILDFPPLGDPGDSLSLTVEGTLAGAAGALAKDTVNADLDVVDNSRIAVEMDKPLHKPGETVHLRMLAAADSGHVDADQPVTVTVADPENKTIEKASLKTNRFGIASYDWKTSEQTAGGDYEVTFDLDNRTGAGSTGVQAVRMQRYELPEFKVQAAPDRDFYLPGEVPKVKLDTAYLFGKPVAAGSVRIVRADLAQWNPRTGRYDEADKTEAKAQLDANGEATVSLQVDDEWQRLQSNSWERYRDVRYRALVTDATTGRTEPRNFAVRLTKEPVHIYLNPLGANEREGEYLLSTAFADGKPAPCKVTLDWMNQKSYAAHALTADTNRYGLAKVTLRYPRDAKGEIEDAPELRITARDAGGRISHFDDQLWSGEEDDLWLSMAHTLLRPGSPIEGTIHGKRGTTVDIDVLSEKAVIEHWQIRMSGEAEPFTLPPSPKFQGLITLRAYTLRGERPENQSYLGARGATRSVLFPEDRSLSASVEGLAATYAPGAKVNAELALRSADKGPTAGVFGVSVSDTAVDERAETEAEDNDRWFGSNWWWLMGPSVGDVTRESLNKTDTTKPIDEDLDLAAAAVLLNASPNPIEVEANGVGEVRNEYRQQMEKKLKPLAEAILKVDPLDLPATLDAVKKYAADAKLAESILLDPWNVPYKVEPGEGWHTDQVKLTSAGPDKQFGTADDFTIVLVERNMFAVPGKRLENILRRAVGDGKPLPATTEALKALALESGLDLDSAAQHTLDRKGKPYVYEIDVVRRSYFARAKSAAGETVWQSAGIDYFSRTEERLREAIEKWTAAGHAFPETEAEARQAFAAAGIDFDSLRDPVGRPFALKSKHEFSYARIDKVKAGAAIQGGTAKMTLAVQVIQVLRTGEKGVSYGDVDEVARFAHTASRQSGGDLSPVTVDAGLFKGNTGAIGGTVTDATGAAVPGARIRVESLGSEFSVSTTAANDGSYTVPDLAPGFYKVHIDANGFESYMLTDVHVASSALTEVDVKLQVGTAAETITVTATSESVMTNSAQVASIAPGAAAFGKQSQSKSPHGSAVITEQTMTPRLRHVFAETAYWAPSLETSSAGRATVNFTLPDSLTTWKLHAVGSTIDGRVTEMERKFKSFQPFFVDLDAPQVLTAGDEISLPVNLRNYTDHAIHLPVTVKPADWFTLMTPATTQATVVPDGSTAVVVGLCAVGLTDAGPLRITAANAHDGDAVEKAVKVHPDGEPRTVTASALLQGGEKSAISFDLSADAIAGSLHAELLLSPNLGANVAHAMKAILERPYGCAEQTISTAYASLLYLELAHAAKIESPEKEKAQAFLQLGYDRLQGYFSASGGLTYWGGSDMAGDAALTAYGIEFLSEAGPYIAVDRQRMTGAIEWLLARQDADGAWKPRYGATSARDTVYIAYALETALRAKNFSDASSGDLPRRMQQAVAKANRYAASSVLALHDPYANALRLMLAAGSGDGATQTRAHDELTASAERMRGEAHWEFDGFSPFYGWGRSGRLETTALALDALESNGSKDDEPLEKSALLYLLQNRDEYGVWMSGQATVRVMKALLPVAVRQLQSKAADNFTLVVNGRPLSAEQAGAIKASGQLLDAPRRIDLSAMMHAGSNTLEFTGGTDASFANAQITAWFYVPWSGAATDKTQTTVPGKDYGLDFGYTCDADGAKVGQPVSCTVSARRFGSESYGMLLAEVGLPPGADVDRAALGKLLDSWSISHYELQPDRIVFYLWPANAADDRFTFQFTPRYAIRAKAAPAKLVDYYNSDFGAVLAPQNFAVKAEK